MERLTQEQAREQFAAIGADSDAINWSDVDGDIIAALGDLPALAQAGVAMRISAAAGLRILIAHKAHLDYEAGRASVLAPIHGAIVAPGDVIQDMEALHAYGGIVRRLRVKSIIDGRVRCENVADLRFTTTVSLKRIHEKPTKKSGYRVVERGGKSVEP